MASRGVKPANQDWLIAEAARLWNGGMPTIEIAQRLGISRRTVNTYLSEGDSGETLRNRPARYIAWHDDAVRMHVEERMTVKEIAAAVRRDYAAVHRLLTLRGVIRRRSGQNKTHEQIIAAWREAGGNMAEAARKIGKSRESVRRHVAQLPGYSPTKLYQGIVSADEFTAMWIKHRGNCVEIAMLLGCEAKSVSNRASRLGLRETYPATQDEAIPAAEFVRIWREFRGNMTRVAGAIGRDWHTVKTRAIRLGLRPAKKPRAAA